MKITAKQYAKSLFESVKDADDKEAKETTKRLVELLASNNQVSQLEKISDYFSSIWNKEKGIVKAEIISANKLDDEVIKLLNDYIVKLLGDKKADIKQKIDKKIKGGFIIRLGDKILDSSLSTRINELKKSLVN